MDGFRPGKGPLKIVAQHYGPQVRSEVIGDAVQKAFSEVVQEQKLKVAGYPRIERKEGGDGKQLTFSATFQITELHLGVDLESVAEGLLFPVATLLALDRRVAGALHLPRLGRLREPHLQG